MLMNTWDLLSTDAWSMPQLDSSAELDVSKDSCLEQIRLDITTAFPFSKNTVEKK